MPRQPRIILTIPDELRAALEAESAKTGAPISEIIRRAVTAYLTAAGHAPPDTSVRHGGRRKRGGG